MTVFIMLIMPLTNKRDFNFGVCEKLSLSACDWDASGTKKRDS